MKMSRISNRSSKRKCTKNTRISRSTTMRRNKMVESKNTKRRDKSMSKKKSKSRTSATTL